MSNPYQAPGAPLGDLPQAPRSSALLLGMLAGSATAIALAWVLPLVSALLAGIVGESMLAPTYFAIELVLVFGVVYGCSVLAMRIAQARPFLAALPIGLLVSALSVWELAVDRGAELHDPLWYQVLLVALPLLAATLAALARSRR